MTATGKREDASDIATATVETPMPGAESIMCAATNSRNDGKKRLEEGLEEMMQGAEGEHREIIRRTLEEIRNG